MEDQDTCRICSAPSEPGQPLFHPCKCSGTIRYIHQDCLTTWLAHSKKTSCDVCKHQYSFTKVYSPEMPQQLPLVLFLRRFIRQLFWGCILCLRVIMIAIIWLALLPYVTIWTWRFYFAVGDQIAWWINDRPRPSSSSPFPSFFSNSSTANTSNATLIFQNRTLYELATNYSVWRSLSSDIFTGQIIASLIVLTFLGVFLLREWIQQNARPGEFDEEDPQRNEEQEPQVQQQAQPQPPDNVLHPLVVEIDVLNAIAADAPSVPSIQEPHPDVPTDVNEGQPNDVDFGDVPERMRKDGRVTSDSSASRSIDAANTDLHTSQDDSQDWAASLELPSSDTDEDDPPRWRRRLYRNEALRDRAQKRDEVSPKAKGSRRPSRAHHVGKMRSTTSRRTSAHEPSLPEPQAAASHTSRTSIKNLGNEDNDYKFTFEINRQDHLSSSTLSSRETSPTPLDSGEASSPESPADLTFSSNSTLSSNSVSTPLFNLRRPPLPTALSPDGVETSPDALESLPSTDSAVPPTSILKETKDTRMGQTPLASPGLATYRAPEQLASNIGAGPSRASDSYFDSDSETADEDVHFSEEHEEDDLLGQYAGEHYFRDPATEADRANNGIERLFVINDMNNFPVPAPDTEDDDDLDDWDEILDPPIDDDDDDDDDPGIEIAVIAADGDVLVPPHRARAGGHQQAEGEVVVQDANDDPDGNIDDDMDGALEEAIGIRGPITTVFQNAALLIFALDTTVGLGVWLPFTIGKTLALLLLEPHRILHLVHLPIRVIRLVTDPFVNLVSFLLQRFAMPAVFVFARNFMGGLMRLCERLVNVLDYDGQSMIERNTALASKVAEFSTAQWNRLALVMASTSTAELNATGWDANFMDRLFPSSESKVWHQLEPYFAFLGREVRLSSMNFKTHWFELASGDATINRIFAIVLGYAAVGLVLAVYLNIINIGSMQNAGRAVRSLVRQHLVIVKVAGFVLIELVLFPLACGVMLDLCTLSLFPDASFVSRIAFSRYAPLTSAFYHWMIGTMFMYQFVMLLSGCRKILRSGAMWFIKDPQDQNFHPIRDILERPTLLQLRKLSVSAMMYFCVVACGMGSVVTSFRLFGRDLIPLRWNMRQPISEIPIDLLLLHIFLPATLHHFRPKKGVRLWTTRYWKFSARQFRLSSYMFGGRYPDEETSTSWPVAALLRSKHALDPKEQQPIEGRFMRVPAEDNVALRRELKATTVVDEDGEPLDEEGRKVIEDQIAEAQKAKREVAKDYTVVYAPPHFTTRIILFIMSLWLCGSLVLVTSIAMPILLGRRLFALWLPHEVHDGYSLMVGFYLLWGCYAAARTLDRMDKRRQRSNSELARGAFALYVAKRATLWSMSISWMFFWMGIIVPILVALAMEFYVVLPLRLIFAPATNIKIHVVESWALGLIYSKMAIHPPRFRPETRVDTAIAKIKQNGWRRPDAVDATVNVICPVIGALLTLLIGPLCITWGLQKVSLLPADGKFIFVYVYPGLFAVSAFFRLCASIITHCASWAQSIRDSEFLVEMQLRNLEPPSASDVSPADSIAKVEAPIPVAEADGLIPVVEVNMPIAAVGGE